MRVRDMKIWALFSVKNEYDQPDNNLVGWWISKPSIECLASAIGISFPAELDQDTVAVVKIWSGEDLRIGNAHYRLHEIEEGAL